MDEFQQRAICHAQGPALVLAGPGSGKTTVIVNRLIRLVKVAKQPPEKIVAISFTRASARELQKKSIQAFPILNKVRFGTFHSFFLSLLKEAGIYDYRDVLDETEKNRVLKTIVQRQLKSNFVAGEVLEIIKSELGKERTIGQGKQVQEQPAQKMIERIRQEYEGYKQDHHKLDFEDILRKTKELLQQDGSFLRQLQDRYQFFFVDEFQDINQVQFEVLQLLLGIGQNIFAVGDEDQSIYGFRGSKPDFLMDFEKHFEQAVVYRILNSYRCPEKIIKLSNRLIEKNNQRTAKQIVSQRKISGEIIVNAFENVEDQAKYIRDQILCQNRPKREYMVIYRTNAQALPLIKELSHSNIPFRAKDFHFNLFDHFIYQDIMAYLRLAMQQMQGENLLKTENRPLVNRILNKPNRGLKNVSMQTRSEVNFLGRLENLVGDHKIDKILKKDLSQMQGQDFEGAIHSILEGIGYNNYLKGYAFHYKVPLDRFLETVEDISGLVDPTSEISVAVRQLQLLEGVNKNLKKDQLMGEDQVLLTTAHGAKGLERPYIFVISMNQGILPHNRSIDDHLEEERRLCYVALTRSQEILDLSYLKSESRQVLEKSLFLTDMGI